jgi:hypothetical protein
MFPVSDPPPHLAQSRPSRQLGPAGTGITICTLNNADVLSAKSIRTRSARAAPAALLGRGFISSSRGAGKRPTS